MSINDTLYRCLERQGLKGSLNDKFNKHLKGMGYRERSSQDMISKVGSYQKYVELVKNLCKEITNTNTPEDNPNEIVYPEITPESPWQESSSGVSKEYFVPDKNGEPKAVRLTLIGTSNHHQWIDLPEPLTRGATYRIEVDINPVTYSDTFEVSYRDDSTELVGEELPVNLTADWQTLSYEFTVPDVEIAIPSIRLLGWGNGTDGSVIEVGHIQLKRKNTTVIGSILKGPGEAISYTDIASYPLPQINSFALLNAVERGLEPVFQPTITSTSVTKTLEEKFGVNLSHEGVWDLEALEIRNVGGANPYMRTHIEAGAYVGSTNMTRGAGWENRIINQDRAILSYQVRFKDGFDFVKGGKLPGLMGGNSPSGGEAATEGFSCRMMWREGGQGELYLYVMNKLTGSGAQQGTGSFIFIPGYWHTIEQEVILNDVGRNNGVIRIWFDGQPAFEQTGIIFRDTLELKIEGIMHTIFFGGGDSTWAATRDEYVDTRNFVIYN